MATLSKKQFHALKQSEKAMLMKPPKKRRNNRRARKGQYPSSAIVQPSRNGSGRKKGQRRQRGGNQLTTAGNTRSFVMPIDEDVGVMVGSILFSYNSSPATVLAINPGNPQLFPFASKTAQNYERYEFESLRFEYRPSVGMYAPSGQQGMVGLSATMDSAQAPPSSQPQADFMFHSKIVETANPTSLSLPKSFLQSKSSREKFLVRQNATIPGGTSPHDYDCGLIFPWTIGQANSNQIGILRVVGKCRLSNPLLAASTNSPPNYTVAVFTVINAPAVASTTPGNFPFTITNINNVGITYTVVNGGAYFNLPPGTWIVDASVDIDQSVTNAAIALSLNAFVEQNGSGQNGPILTNSCAAISTSTSHCSVSYSYAVTSNGNTQFALSYTPTYTAGAPDVDGIIRFTAV